MKIDIDTVINQIDTRIDLWEFHRKELIKAVISTAPADSIVEELAELKIFLIEAKGEGTK